MNQEKELIGFVVDQVIDFMLKQAADKGAVVTKSDILLAITHDPEGNTANRFAELFALGFNAVVCCAHE
jgi:hypothetical protein